MNYAISSAEAVSHQEGWVIHRFVELSSSYYHDLSSISRRVFFTTAVSILGKFCRHIPTLLALVSLTHRTTKTALLTYDACCTLEEEIEFIWKRQFSIPSLLYVVIRTSTLGSAITTVVSAFTPINIKVRHSMMLQYQLS